MMNMISNISIFDFATDKLLVVVSDQTIQDTEACSSGVPDKFLDIILIHVTSCYYFNLFNEVVNADYSLSILLLTQYDETNNVQDPLIE